MKRVITARSLRSSEGSHSSSPAIGAEPSLCGMRVVVAGGHGQIGRLLLQILAERGDAAVGLIRNPDHAEDLRSIGAVPLVHDLEAEEGIELQADAVVFAAGAGPGSGAERKWTIDYGGAAKLMRAGARR